MDAICTQPSHATHPSRRTDDGRRGGSPSVAEIASGVMFFIMAGGFYVASLLIKDEAEGREQKHRRFRCVFGAVQVFRSKDRKQNRSGRVFEGFGRVFDRVKNDS